MKSDMKYNALQRTIEGLLLYMLVTFITMRKKQMKKRLPTIDELASTFEVLFCVAGIVWIICHW